MSDQSIIHFVTDTYEEARRVEERALLTSSVETDVEEDGRTERKKRLRPTEFNDPCECICLNI